MRVTIFDYGAGNLHSLAKAIGSAASELIVEEDPAKAVNTDVLVLPGVGAFRSPFRQGADQRRVLREQFRLPSRR